jgi:hypothetical protein
MAKQHNGNHMMSYAQYSMLAATGGLIASGITGSVFPLAVVVVGLFLLLSFFTGMSGDAAATKARRRLAA